MKKITVLLGTANRNGNTIKLLNTYLNRLRRKTDFTVDILSIYGIKILACDGCGFCFDKDVCPKNKFDDFLKIIGLIQESDHFILASPIYFSGYPSKLKAFIDRTEQFYCRKKRKGEIKNLKLLSGGLVLTGGNLNRVNIESAINCCKQFFDCIDIKLKHKLIAPKTDNSKI